ncbi:hypothetical protein HYT53_01080 [Candidatus Woesearchaeota archaeon]|nr:hypothetical protein [Candidatus Woesearchaeota archaeon]
MDANTAAYIKFLEPQKAFEQQYKPKPKAFAQSAAGIGLEKKFYPGILKDIESNLEGALLLDVPYEECKIQHRYKQGVKNNMLVALFVYDSAQKIDRIFFWRSPDGRPLGVYYKPDSANWKDSNNVLVMVYDVNNLSRHDVENTKKCSDSHEKRQKEENLRKKREELEDMLSIEKV